MISLRPPRAAPTFKPFNVSGNPANEGAARGGGGAASSNRHASERWHPCGFGDTEAAWTPAFAGVTGWNVAVLDSDVLIVGAGHNALVCAFYLARRGLKVTMLEARGVVGG